MRDLSPTGKRVVIVGFILMELVFAANYYLKLGLVARNPKETMVVGFVAMVLVALYLHPSSDDQGGRSDDPNRT